MRSDLAHKSNHKPGEPLPSSLHLLDETKQIRFIHTIIRSRDTSRDEFIFYSNRLMRLLIEFALSLLPFEVNLYSSLFNYFIQIALKFVIYKKNHLLRMWWCRRPAGDSTKANGT